MARRILQVGDRVGFCIANEDGTASFATVVPGGNSCVIVVRTDDGEEFPTPRGTIFYAPLVVGAA